MTTKRVASKKRWTARFPTPSSNDDGTVRGIRSVSHENLLAPALGAMLFSPRGGLITEGVPIPNADAIRARVERFTFVSIPDHVPETVWQMFEIAKGTMVYGLFFYPLYSLGEDHLTRLFEWMVKERYRHHSGTANDGNLQMVVRWLLR